MIAPTRKFSTVLPSVASLRSKFEKPGQSPPTAPLMRVPSSGGLLKSANSQTALLKSPSSQGQGLKATTSVGAVKAGTNEPSVVSVSINGEGMAAAPSLRNLVVKTTLETTIEETASEVKTPTTPNSVRDSVTETRRTSIVDSRKPSITPVETRKPSITPVEVRRPSLVGSTQQPPTETRRASLVGSNQQQPPTETRRASLVGSSSPVEASEATEAVRKQSIVSTPPPVPAPAPPPTAPPPKPPAEPHPNDVVAQQAPGKQQEPVVSHEQQISSLKKEGLVYCVDGYGWALDAMRNLAREIQACLRKEGFIDPTSCRSIGMQSFLDNCEAVLAFVESATVSGTVRYQIARGVFLGKKLALFYVGNLQSPQNIELLDSLVTQLASTPEDSLGKSKEEWRTILSSSMIPFVFSPSSKERSAVTLAPLEQLLCGNSNVFGGNQVVISDPPPPLCIFFLTGFDIDTLDRLCIELQSRGYPAFVSETVVKSNSAIFVLPTQSDLAKKDYIEKRIALESNLRECKLRGMPCVGVLPFGCLDSAPAWVPGELEGQVLPRDLAPEDIIRASDAPALALKIQGDALEPFRIVTEKARKFSPESGRDEVRLELLQSKTDKITILTAPSGWGKTTLLAELCRRHSKIVSCLSRSVWDQSETVAAVFFFNRLDPSRSNFTAHCIKSISRQLCGSVPGFALEESAIEAMEDPSTSVTMLLEQLIVQPAATLSSKGRPPTRRVLAVIDALDECEDFDQLQTALNAKWQSVPNWLNLICSTQNRPQIVARHLEVGADTKTKSHLSNYLNHVLGSIWQCPDASKVTSMLEEKSSSDFLWLSICEPILVNACESAALAGAQETLSFFEQALPPSPGIESAVKFVFDRFSEQEAVGEGAEKVRQMYSLAVCVPRSFLPVEIYSYCGIERIPPLLVIEDLCVKPLHARVLDTLLGDCGVKLDVVKDNALVSDALEKAYLDSAQTTQTAKRFAASHANRHARLAERIPIAKTWFEDFSRLYDAVAQCVRETGDALRVAQDGEDCGAADDVVDVVRLASSAVSFDVREFPGQVIGRLGANHPLSAKALEFAKSVLVQGDQTMVALPNPYFSGLTGARGPLRKVLRHRGPVLATAESNGHALTCAGPVGFIWNVNRTEKLGILKGHSEDIKCCTFGTGQASEPNGPVPFMAITGGADATIKLWQGAVRSGQLNMNFASVRSYVGHDSAVTCLVYRADASRGVIFCSGSVDKTIIVWDFNSGQQRNRFRGHAGEVRSIALSADSTILLSGSHDKTCRLWELSTGKDLGRLEGHPRDVSAVCVRSDRYFTACFDGVARSFDAKSKKLVHEFKGHTQRINSMSLSLDGRLLATSSFDGTARVFDADSGEMLIVLKGHSNDVSCVRFCSEPSRCITSSLDCEVRLWSVSPEKIERYRAMAKLKHEEQVTCVGLSSSFACSGSSDGSARVWSLENGNMLCELKGHDESLSAVAVSHDGKIAVTGAEDGEVRIWEVAQGQHKELYCLSEHQDAIESVAVSEDGRYARSISYDKQIYVWDLSTGRTLAAGSNVKVDFVMPPIFRKQESRHVLGPTGSSVGFTLDSSGFAVALQNDDDSLKPRTYGELGDGFYLWEWYS